MGSKKSEQPVYLREMADALGRQPNTLRTWIRDGALPAALEPERETEGRKSIFWRRRQIAALRKWADEKLSLQGWQSSR